MGLGNYRLPYRGEDTSIKGDSLLSASWLNGRVKARREAKIIDMYGKWREYGVQRRKEILGR